jgi:hypothetical protein
MQNGTSVTATFGDPNEGAKIKACIIGSTDTARINILVVGFEVKEVAPAEQYCDGTSVDLFISPLPAGTPSAYLGCFSDFKLYSETVDQSYGNPAGTTTLDFTPVDGNMHCAIKNVMWYGTVSNYCNDYSGYRIWASARDKDDKLVTTAARLEITADASRDCVTGEARCCANYFTGYPDIEATEFTPGTWTVTITRGLFVKDVLAKPITLNVNPNSQYYQLTKDEEIYHSEQYEGIKPSDCYDQGFIVDSVLNNVNKYLITGPTAEIAIATAQQYIDGCINNEKIRSINLWWTISCSCSREYEAKTHLGELYNGRWECSHPECLK